MLFELGNHLGELAVSLSHGDVIPKGGVNFVALEAKRRLVSSDTNTETAAARQKPASNDVALTLAADFLSIRHVTIIATAADVKQQTTR